MISESYKSFLLISSVLFLLILIGSCATPMGPTGGEPDRTPPKVVSTYPENGTTNFDDDEVEFTFDKFIERNSFRQNVSIEPDLAIEIDFSFRRRTATVSFTDPLPENTTVVVKVGTDVTDTNNNKMGSSFDLAVSTGDVLDQGRINGRIVNAQEGSGEDGYRIFLYREPHDLTTRANYVAQTDTSGQFEFGYIGEGTYKAFWVNDGNRNRVWDRDRELAQPFNIEMFELGESQEIDIGTLFASIPDTISPNVEGVGLLSERRLRLRISEEVEWENDSFFTVKDTLDNEITSAVPLYSPDNDPNVLFAQSEEALSEEESHTLSADGITDAAGNRLRMDFSPFLGSNEPDTTELRTISHNARNGLFPGEALEITYSKFIDDDSVVDSLVVIEGDQTRENWEAVEIERHILRILPQDTWESGVQYQFRVWNPYEEEREQIDPDFWQKNELGSIEIELENSNPEIDKILRITDSDRSIRIDSTFTGSVTIDDLPPLEYKVIVFEDVNGNEVWDPGSVDPYEKPEPYAIRRRVPVREGFTSEVDLQFPADTIEADNIEEDTDNFPDPDDIDPDEIDNDNDEN